MSASGPMPFSRLGDTTTTADLTLDRLNSRKSLLEQFDDARRARDATRGFDKYREMAYSLIGTRAVRDALDIAASRWGFAIAMA